MHAGDDSEHDVRQIVYTLEGAERTDLLAMYHDYALGRMQVPGDSEQGVGVNSLLIGGT